MMGERTVLQESLFYSFNLDRHVPIAHLDAAELKGRAVWQGLPPA